MTAPARGAEDLPHRRISAQRCIGGGVPTIGATQLRRLAGRVAAPLHRAGALLRSREVLDVRGMNRQRRGSDGNQARQVRQDPTAQWSALGCVYTAGT